MTNSSCLNLKSTLYTLLAAAALASALHGQNIIVSDNIITMAEGQSEPIDGYIAVDSRGIIIAVGEGTPPLHLLNGAEKIDARGNIILPGFISGHSHLWQSAFRGIAPEETLYGWLDQLHRTYGQHMEDGDMYAFTKYGALDQLSHGITTTFNHSQDIAPTYEHYLEQFHAAMKVDQHFVFAYVLDKSAATREQRRERFVELLEKHARAEMPNLCLGFAIHGVGVHRDPELMAEEAELAREFGLDMQIHYLEEKAQSYESGQDRFTAIEKSGALWEGMVYAHFIHPTDEILEKSIEVGAKMIWNPLSNGRLASGIADIPRYRDAGLAIGMGVDGAASADIQDPFENMRMGMYSLRMRDSDATTLKAEEMFRLHTLETARVLNIEDRVGSLEAGKYADFLIIDPSRPAIGPIFDPYASLLFAAHSANIDSVWVRGRKVMERGKSLNHDQAALHREVLERVARIREAAGH